MNVIESALNPIMHIWEAFYAGKTTELIKEAFS